MRKPSTFFAIVGLLILLSMIGLGSGSIMAYTDSQKPDASDVINRVPEKSKDCSPAEEKWWNDVRDKAGQILYSNKLIGDAERERSQALNQIIAEHRKNHRPLDRIDSPELQRLKKKIWDLELEREGHIKEFLASINNGTANNYRPPVDHNKMILLRMPRPDYTEEARKNKIIGNIVVQAQFQDTGRIADIKVLNGLGYGLDEKAIEAVSKIVFLPSIVDGQFQTIRSPIRVSFSLL